MTVYINEQYFTQEGYGFDVDNMADWLNKSGMGLSDNYVDACNLFGEDFIHKHIFMWYWWDTYLNSPDGDGDFDTLDTSAYKFTAMKDADTSPQGFHFWNVLDATTAMKDNDEIDFPAVAAQLDKSIMSRNDWVECNARFAASCGGVQ